MQKQLITVIVLTGMVMGASEAYCVTASAGGGVVGSKHDMNVFITANSGTKDAEGRVCAYCHTPHHALGIGGDTVVINYKDTNGADQHVNYIVYSPLWSRQSISATAKFAQYVSASFNPGVMGVPYDNLIGPSRLCMTCHDGVIAVDSYYGQVGTSSQKGDDLLNMFGTNHFAVGSGTIGLSNDHPIGMRYADFYLSKSFNSTSYELNDPATSRFSGANKTIRDVLFTDTNGGDPNATGFMTCASCHDVHNSTEVGNTNPVTAGRGYFLRSTQDKSAFCLVCHIK